MYVLLTLPVAKLTFFLQSRAINMNKMTKIDDINKTYLSIKHELEVKRDRL